MNLPLKTDLLVDVTLLVVTCVLNKTNNGYQEQIDQPLVTPSSHPNYKTVFFLSHLGNQRSFHILGYVRGALPCLQEPTVKPDSGT
jgi:hypothetical protein